MKSRSSTAIIFFFVGSIICTHAQMAEGVLKVDSSLLSNRNDILSLKCTWEFYWKKLLTPDSFRLNRHSFTSINVPGSWRQLSIQNSLLPQTGFGTYRLCIINEDNLDDLVMKFSGISTSCKIWVNNTLAESQGIVAASESEFKACRVNANIHLPATDSIFIVVQVANFNFFQGGISHEVFLGREKSMDKQNHLAESYEMIFNGILLMMILYNAAYAFHLGKNGRSYLFVGLICITILFRSLVVYDGSLFLFRLLPEISFVLVKRIEIALINCNVFLLPVAFSCLFNYCTAYARILKFFLLVGSLMVLWALTLPGETLELNIKIFIFAMLVAYSYSIVILIKAWYEKRPGARLLLCGTIISLAFVIVEMMKFNELLAISNRYDLPNPVTVALVIFLIFQTLVVSVLFSRSLDESQHRALDLSMKVREQTIKLEHSNHIKDIMFSVISHDLKSPLNSLKGIVDLCASKFISTEEIKTLMTPLRYSLQSNTQLLDNLLSWSKLQMNNLLIRPQEVGLYGLVEEHFILYKPIAEAKNIQLINTVPVDVQVLADADVVRLIFRNLISNAIKFTPNSGQIIVSAQVSSKSVWVAISDTGVGMSEQKSKQLFEISPMERTAFTTLGTNREKGTGLGLSICKEFVELSKGSLKVESREGKGTTFKFSLLQVT